MKSPVRLQFDRFSKWITQKLEDGTKGFFLCLFLLAVVAAGTLFSVWASMRIAEACFDNPYLRAWLGMSVGFSLWGFGWMIGRAIQDSARGEERLIWRYHAIVLIVVTMASIFAGIAWGVGFLISIWPTGRIGSALLVVAFIAGSIALNWQDVKYWRPTLFLSSLFRRRSKDDE